MDEAALSATRDELNDYCEAVNRPVGASQERPIDLFGVILPAIARLSTVENPLIDAPAALKWNEIETQRKRDLIKSLQQRLRSTGMPSTPGWGSSIRVVLPATRDRLRQACKQCDDAATRLEQHGQTLAALLGTEQPMTPADISRLLSSRHQAARFSTVAGIGSRERNLGQTTVDHSQDDQSRQGTG